METHFTTEQAAIEPPSIDANGLTTRKNVGEKERYASLAGGAALVAYGLSRKSIGGALLALTGGSLLYRGATGKCGVYKALHINRNTAGVDGILVQRNITVNTDPMSAYRYWRRLENLPRFMDHLESVREIDTIRSHWVAKAPAGLTVEWDAEILEDVPAHHIAWASLEGAMVPNRGSVAFVPIINGTGTEVKVSLRYEPPGGSIGAAFAKLFGEEPSIQVEEDLRRFKQVVELGNPSPTTGQPYGGTII